MNAVLRSGFLLDVRRKRFFVFRSLVVGLPLLVIFLLATITESAGDRLGAWIMTGTSNMLLCLILLLAPGLCAPVLAEERRNNKLAVLRAGPASVSGVVFGRWLSRVFVLGLCVLAALPVCASALVFGGVTPGHFLRMAAVELSTLLWVSTVSLAIGARTAQPGAAIRAAYGLVFSVILVAYLVRGVAQISIMSGADPGWARAAMAFGTFANPFSVLSWSLAVVPTPGVFWSEVTVLYASGAVAVTAALLPLCARWMLRERRVVPAASASGQMSRDEAPAGVADAAPVGDCDGERRLRAVASGRYSRKLAFLWANPLLWLEVLRGPRGHRSRVPVFLTWSVILVLEGWLLTTLLSQDSSRGTFGFQGMAINFIAAGAAMILAFLGGAGTACGAFHRETETRTAEVLHAAPRSDRDFVRAKLVGVLRTALPAWLLSVFHVVLALIGSRTGDGAILGFLGYVFYSGVLILALAAFALVRSLTSKNSSIAAFRTFGAMFLFCVVLPFAVGLVLFNTVDSAAAGGFLIGWHPGVVLVTPLLMAHDRSSLEGFAIWPLLYGVCYLGYAVTTIGTKLPRLHAACRRGERPWERPLRLLEES